MPPATMPLSLQGCAHWNCHTSNAPKSSTRKLLLCHRMIHWHGRLCVCVCACVCACMCALCVLVCVCACVCVRTHVFNSLIYCCRAWPATTTESHLKMQRSVAMLSEHTSSAYSSSKGECRQVACTCLWTTAFVTSSLLHCQRGTAGEDNEGEVG